MKSLSPKPCENCGLSLERKTYDDGMKEAWVRLALRRFCNRTCARAYRLRMLGSLQERFERKVLICGNGCWEWQGYVAVDGYGSFRFEREGDHTHRWAWRIYRGQIPDNSCVLHRCDNMRCVNPEHLFLGSHADNVIDKIRKGRQPRGESCHNARLSEEDVLEIRRMHDAGIRNKRIACRFDISLTHVGHIVRGRLWKHVEAEVIQCA